MVFCPQLPPPLPPLGGFVPFWHWIYLLQWKIPFQWYKYHFSINSCRTTRFPTQMWCVSEDLPPIRDFFRSFLFYKKVEGQRGTLLRSHVKSSGAISHEFLSPENSDSELRLCPDEYIWREKIIKVTHLNNDIPSFRWINFMFGKKLALLTKHGLFFFFLFFSF